jgi:acyl-CoA synthetase (AMP-forming)/AMP-acid ligase II
MVRPRDAQVPRPEDAVRRWARELPDVPAAVSRGDGRRLTWAELDDSADRLVAYFATRGLEPGSRVCWLGRNDPTYLTVLVACRRARLVFVGLNWRLPSDEVLRAAASVDPALVVGQEGLLTEAADGSHVVVPWSSPPPWHDLEPAAELEPRDDDPLIMFFTSGATGIPKSVLLDRHAHDLAIAEWSSLVFTPDDRLLVVPPQFHLAGATWAQYGLLFGATQVYLGDTSAGAIVEALVEERITHALMVPVLLHLLVGELQARPRELPELAFVAYGASPIQPPLLRSILELTSCRLVQVYGLSEAGGVVVELPPADHQPDDPHLLSTGRPINSTELKIVDPASGQAVPPGRLGEIVLRCDHLMRGYWGQPELTDTVLRDGWLYTRDAGWLDEDGYLYIQGRIDDMIITGGENVQPAEVERVLGELPGVDECAVYGVPDPRWGQRLTAAVVLKPAAELDEATVIEWCRTRLAGYQVPKSVVLVPMLPRNATGKLLRRELPSLSTD